MKIERGFSVFDSNHDEILDNTNCYIQFMGSAKKYLGILLKPNKNF